MTRNGHAGDLVGSYVLDACSLDEGESIDQHASRCPECAAEIAALRRVTEQIGVSAALPPPSGLRSRVLSAALTARPAAAEPPRLGSQYRLQVEELDELLSGLSAAEWRLPAGGHESVRDLMVHLHANDRPVASAAGVDPPPSEATVHTRWRRQADGIIDVVSRRGFSLDREVPLAGRAAIRRPLREALVQRSFETWVHAEDIRQLVQLPPRGPSPEQVADIVDFALRLLPGALEAAGRHRPAAAIRLVLIGGGDRLVGMAPQNPATGTVVAEVAMPSERFCRLLAGRLPVSSAEARVEGDPDAALDFLTVAATMGCE